MKLDTQEMAHLAQTAAQNPRPDMYSTIHKALRSAMADALVALGRVDTQDAADFGACAVRLESLLQFCRDHLAHENGFVHPAIEARAPGQSMAIADEHVSHVQHIDALQAALQRLLNAPLAQRDALALALYRQLALFIADNFQHMHLEEINHNAALWTHYSDAELNDIHQRLVAAIAPQEMMATLRWLVPAMNPAERVGLLDDMRAHAPAPAFAAALDVVRPHLSAAEWAKLVRGLGL